MSQPPATTSAASRHEEEESSEEEELPDHLPEHGHTQDPLPELFKLPSGVPARFFLHKSLTAGMKAQVTKAIEAHGGHITMLEKHANIVLVSETRLTTDLATMKLRYDVHSDPVFRDIHVESLTFLRRCLNTGFFEIGGERMIKMGMPGPRPRKEGHVYRE